MEKIISQPVFKDSILESITQSISLPELKKKEDIYLALLESIVSQQVSIKAADTIFKRFLALFENNYPHAHILHETETDLLRSAGLSGQKAQYLKNVAKFSIENGLEVEKIESLSTSEIITYLTQIKGVGKWTVEMILIFSLCHPDIFSVDDLVIRQVMIKLYNLNAQDKHLKSKLIEISDNWKPNRSLACRYLWRWKDNL
jgi:DNA-3-methyladenine glycosylase II